jgi:hypothetical protein
MTLEKVLCLFGCLLLSNFSFAHAPQSTSLIRADYAVATLEKTAAPQVPAAPQADDEDDDEDEG